MTRLRTSVFVIVNFEQADKLAYAEELRDQLVARKVSTRLVDAAGDIVSLVKKEKKSLFVSDFFLGSLGTVIDLAEAAGSGFNFIVWTDEDSVFSSVECMKAGALDYKVMKPGQSIEQIVLRNIGSASDKNTLKEKISSEFADQLEREYLTVKTKFDTFGSLILESGDPLTEELIISRFNEIKIDLSSWEGRFSELAEGRQYILLNAHLAEFELASIITGNLLLCSTCNTSTLQKLTSLEVHRTNIEISKHYKDYDWPGGLRQLLLMQALEERGLPAADAYQKSFSGQTSEDVEFSSADLLAELRKHFGNVRLTAARLGVSPSAILEHLS